MSETRTETHAEKALRILDSSWDGDMTAIGTAIVHAAVDISEQLRALTREQRMFNLLTGRTYLGSAYLGTELAETLNQQILQYLTATTEPEGTPS